ncbi:unnamed protein product, partial [Rotaria magnacalcarata]
QQQQEEGHDDDEEEEHNENEEPSQQENLSSLSTTTTAATLLVDDDLRLKMVKTDHEQIAKKSPSPERPLPPVVLPKQPVNKKKTNTMTRKIERHQENLASKSKQQETTSTSSVPSITNTDDGWQEVIGKQKKITIPHEQYSRIIGRSGSNLNVLREVTGASIDVENKKAIGDKTILIK